MLLVSAHHCLLKYACRSFELVNKDICSNGRGNRGFSWLPNRIGNCSDAEVCLEKPEKCRKDKTVAGSGCGLTDTGRARPLPWEEIYKGSLPEGIYLSPVHPAGAGISGQQCLWPKLQRPVLNAGVHWKL